MALTIKKMQGYIKMLVGLTREGGKTKGSNYVDKNGGGQKMYGEN
jgi:hypothetical protein